MQVYTYGLTTIVLALEKQKTRSFTVKLVLCAHGALALPAKLAFSKFLIYNQSLA